MGLQSASKCFGVSEAALCFLVIGWQVGRGFGLLPELSRWVHFTFGTWRRGLSRGQVLSSLESLYMNSENQSSIWLSSRVNCVWVGRCRLMSVFVLFCRCVFKLVKYHEKQYRRFISSASFVFGIDF